MKKAFLLPSRHDEKIAAALARAADTSATAYERREAESEWRHLVMRRRLEVWCIGVRAFGKYHVYLLLLVLVLSSNRAVEAFGEKRYAVLLLPLVLLVGISARGGACIAMVEIMRERTAKRFPMPDDLE